MSLDELGAEKQAQLRTAKAVLRPVTFIAVVTAFALCFWKFGLGLLLSIVVAALIFPVMLFVVVLPVGYVLGKRSARRFKERLRG